MRYANHYILSELMNVIETGDPRAIRREFGRYMKRYREDTDFCRLGMLAVYSAALRNGTLEEIKARLRCLRETRRIEAVRRCAELFSTQLSYR